MLFRVIIRLKNGDHYYVRFRRRDEADVFKQLCESDLDDPNIRDVHLVRVDKPRGPKAPATDPSKVWCPYCRDWRDFHSWNNYRLCEVCRVSDADFYVSLYNNKRPTPTRRRKRKKKRAFTEREGLESLWKGQQTRICSRPD